MRAHERPSFCASPHIRATPAYQRYCLSDSIPARRRSCDLAVASSRWTHSYLLPDLSFCGRNRLYSCPNPADDAPVHLRLRIPPRSTASDILVPCQPGWLLDCPQEYVQGAIAIYGSGPLYYVTQYNRHEMPVGGTRPPIYT